jgi:hypothetical protein
MPICLLLILQLQSAKEQSMSLGGIIVPLVLQSLEPGVGYITVINMLITDPGSSFRFQCT